MDNSKRFTSSLGFKYPTLRDHPLHTGEMWLEGKRADDGAEGLWRIHDNLYDLNNFSTNHPGGKDWICLTKGTDITEAFETHHLKGVAENLLPKYFIRKAKGARNSPFTFHNDGFYKTLKRKISAELPKLPKAATERSKKIIDVLAVTYIILSLLAVYKKSYSLGMLSGIVLSLTAIAAHNFFHQRDNFRMYYFNLTLMQSKSWRISHALSHHLYTNTIYDLEISTVEPFLEYLPAKRHFIFRYIQWIVSPFLYCLIFIGEFIKNLVQILIFKTEFSYIIFLPFTILFSMIAVSGGEIYCSLLMFLWIQVVGGLHFGAVGLNAAHHHPDIFHDGDAARPKNEMDWGIYQVDAVMDRKDITGSHFLVLTNFGDHALHHLFPTIDHGALEHLYGVFIKTCAEFGVEWKMVSQIDLVKGQFLQLIKTEGKKEPPSPLKKFRFS